MKARKTGFIALAVALAAAAVTLVITAAPSAGPVRKHQPQATIKAAWIYVGPINDGGWTRPTTRAASTSRRRSARKVETTYKENVPKGPQTRRSSRASSRTATRSSSPPPSASRPAWSRRPRSTRTCKFEHGDRAPRTLREPGHLLRRGRGLDLPRRHGGRGRDQEGHHRLRRPVPDPRGDPPHQRLRARRAVTHPGAKVKLIWTNSWFDAGQGAQGGREPHAGRLRRARAKRRQPRCGRVRGVEGLPWVGYDSDARKFAPKQWLTAAIYNWGPYYCGASRRHMNGTWKTGFYYGDMKDGFTGLAPFGPKVCRQDAGGDRQEEGRDHRAASSTSSRARSRTRRASCAVPKGKRLTVKQLYAMDWLVKGVDRQPRRARAARAGERRPFPARPDAARAEHPSGRQVRGITKRFPGVVANDGVDFEAARGEVHALLGENGAGQVDALEILTGLYRPDEGEIALHGRARRSSTRPGTRSTPASAWCTSTSGWSRRSPSPRTSCSATTGARRAVPVRPRAIERRVAELGERYGLAVDPRARSGSCRSASSSGSRS